MAWRFGGVRPGMTLTLHVERCRGCGRRQAYDLVDVSPGVDAYPGGPLFGCPTCASRGRPTRLFLTLIHLIALVHQDRARLGLATRPYIVERQDGGAVHLPQDGVRLRLTVPECPACRQPGAFLLLDVTDSGATFTCPHRCAMEWHLHLTDLVALLIASGRPDGYSAHWRHLLPPTDRRTGELLGVLKEEYAEGKVYFDRPGTAAARLVVTPRSSLWQGYGHEHQGGPAGAPPEGRVGGR